MNLETLGDLNRRTTGDHVTDAIFQHDALVCSDLRKDEDPLDESGSCISLWRADKLALEGLLINSILIRVPIIGSRGIRYWWLMSANSAEPVGKHLGTLDGAKKKARNILDEWQNIVNGPPRPKRQALPRG